MIDFQKVRKGDILKIVGRGAPGWAAHGSLVRVVLPGINEVLVERPDGAQADFTNNCGAARLEPTEWRDSFPESDA